jgi:hypothetical protein
MHQNAALKFEVFMAVELGIVGFLVVTQYNLGVALNLSQKL